ncbi:type I secretion system permease/ATPase [Palleronia sp. KMU-117]|uniref:type I secretion system permease/ATPase n=1 Tax=Palleronia sp. KMU-117 TaxID=3434108 RepID=UPI003D73C5C2
MTEGSARPDGVPAPEITEVRRRGLALIVVAFVFSIFVNILMLTGPLFMLQVYDRVLSSRSEETLLALTVLVAALYALMSVLDYARGRVLARYGARFQSALDARVFKATLTPGKADPKQRLTALGDVEAVQALYASPAFTAILDTPFTPLFIAAIFIFHPMLGWVALGGGVLLIVITILNRVLTKKRLEAAQVAAEEAKRFSDNARLAREVIRSQGMLPAVAERWTDKRRKALDEAMRAADRTGTFGSVSKGLRLFLQSFILAVGAWLVLEGQVTAGAMIAASILMGRALAPIEQLIGRWPQVERARSGLKSLRGFLSAIREPAARTALPRPEARLSVRNLTVVAGEDRHPILRAISFEVEPGQALGVIGRSGSGKTTLARAIVGLQTAAAGEVRLGGALLDQYAPDTLGRHIGYLPQDPMMVDGTIAENIARMSLTPDSERIVAAAQAAKVHQLILGLRQGYDTPVRGNQVELSGGQKQRVALARALYEDPVLLVLDEPNSALDMEGSEALNAAVRHMKSEGKTVIIMTHRPTAISECDNLLVLDDGRITAQGPRDEVLRSMVKNAADVQQAIARKTSS